MRLPRNCANKQVWTALNCYDSFFEHLRALGSRGFNLNWGTWDHAIADYIGDSFTCRNASWYVDMSEDDRYLLFLMDWSEVVNCPMHDVNLMFNYGLMQFLKTTEEDLRNVWGVCEAFRGGFSELMNRLHVLTDLITLVDRRNNKKEGVRWRSRREPHASSLARLPARSELVPRLSPAKRMLVCPPRHSTLRSVHFKGRWSLGKSMAELVGREESKSLGPRRPCTGYVHFN